MSGERPTRSRTPRSPSRRSLRFGTTAGALIASAAVVACSFIIDSSRVQCESDADCAELGGALVGQTCSAQKVCVAGGPCSVNRDCVSRLGAPAVCRQADRQCVALKTPECDRVTGDPNDDGAIVVGGLTPKAGAGADRGRAIENAVELAIGEMAKSGGVQLGADGTPHGLLFVGCSEGLVSPGDAGTGSLRLNALARQRAIDHLVNDLGAPVIVGPTSSDGAIEVAPLTTPRDVLLMSPSATAAVLGGITDNDLVWRIPPPDTYQATALKFAIEQIASRVGTPNVRLTAVARRDSYGQGLTDAVIAQLVLNGKSPTDPANKDSGTNRPNFVRIDYDDPSAKGDVDFAPVAASIIEPIPHIILLAGGDEAVANLVASVEAGWNPQGLPRLKPLWVVAHESKTALLLQQVATSPDRSDASDSLRDRIAYTEPGRATNNGSRDAFLTRYRAVATYANADPTAFGVAGAYDAAYLIALAATSAGKTRPTGAQLTAGLRKLIVSNTTPIDVGPGKFSQAVQALRAGQSIKVTGAFGPLNFDAKGDAADGVEIGCVNNNANSGLPQFFFPGRYLDAQSRALAGATEFDINRCPVFAAHR